MKLSKTDYKKIAIKAAEAGDSKKAENILILDLGGKSSLADFLVLMTVESTPQLEAVEEEISIRLKQEGVYCLHKDGGQSKSWKVLDYGGVMVHVLESKAAETFTIDKVYAEAKPVEWKKPEAVKAVSKKIPAARTAAAKAKKPAVAKAPAKKKPARKAPAIKKPAAKKTSAKAKKLPKKPLKKALKKAAAKKPLKAAGKPAARKAVKKASKKK